MDYLINGKYKIIDKVVSEKEERLKLFERELFSKKMQYENYKQVADKKANVIEKLIKDISDYENAIRELTEEIREILLKA